MSISVKLSEQLYLLHICLFEITSLEIKRKLKQNPAKYNNKINNKNFNNKSLRCILDFISEEAFKFCIPLYLSSIALTFFKTKLEEN